MAATNTKPWVRESVRIGKIGAWRATAGTFRKQKDQKISGLLTLEPTNPNALRMYVKDKTQLKKRRERQMCRVFFAPSCVISCLVI